MRTILILISLLISNQSITQKLDNVWLLGYGFERPPEQIKKPLGGVNIYFEGKEHKIEYSDRGAHFDWTNASICTDDGELLFYTNGIYIADSNDEIIKNGDNINEWVNYGYLLPQGAIILPHPNGNNQYVLINGRSEIRNNGGKFEGVIHELLYSVIEYHTTLDELEVISKSNVLSNKDLAWGFITACKHANGRDWWIAVPQFKTNCIEIYLLSPDGIRLDNSQCFLNHTFGYGTGNATFSSTGKIYAITEGKYSDKPKSINLFDFDRCAGVFTHKEKLILNDTTVVFESVISSNNRFLYTISRKLIHQFDLESNNLALSEVIVAEYDGFIDQTNTHFMNAALAPNGKIYINSVSSSYYLHVINHPDRKGLACDVQQHSVRLPAYNCRTMPNFPNYRLGKLEGSPCDSIVSNVKDKLHEKQVMRIFPNPGTGPFTVHLSFSNQRSEPISLEIYDLNGQLHRVHTIESSTKSYSVARGGLPAGTFIFKLTNGQKVIASQKVVIVD